MTPNEAYTILRNKVSELIVKMNAQKNEEKIMKVLDEYIEECGKNSHYDQVANVNALVRMYDNGDVKGFLGAINEQDTLRHIYKI